MADVYPNDADGDALRRVAADGADMSRPMVIDYTVDAPDQATALLIAERVAPRGYDPSISQDEDGGTWSIYCSRSMLATYAGVVSAQTELNELVRPYGATCDGWGTFGNTQTLEVRLRS